MISRRLAGFLLIGAFALSYTEALTAAACSMGTSTDMAMEMDMPMPMPADHDDSDAPQPDCPLSMPGAPTNCVFSSALAPDSAMGVAQFAHRMPTFSSDAVHYQLLLARSAFHPPKA